MEVGRHLKISRSRSLVMYTCFLTSLNMLLLRPLIIDYQKARQDLWWNNQCFLDRSISPCTWSWRTLQSELIHFTRTQRPPNTHESFHIGLSQENKVDIIRTPANRTKPESVRCGPKNAHFPLRTTPYRFLCRILDRSIFVFLAVW